MSEPAELNERVTRLEKEVREARQDAAAARILAGGADRDVSEMRTELRAHTGSLQALRDTQVEQGKVLATHGQRLDRLGHKVDTGFAKVDRRFTEMQAEMDRRFAKLEGVHGEMNQRFTALEGEVNQCFTALEGEVNQRFTALEGEMRRGFAVLGGGQQRITELLTDRIDGEGSSG